MNYLERYQNGEYDQVWDELLALGPDVREESNYQQAIEVANETMGRVRRNCELIIARLKAMGYRFGFYPDGTKHYNSEPLIGPTRESREALVEVEREYGPLPLSLVAFWQEVGTVDFIGRHAEWPNGLDPLVVWPPEAIDSCIYEEEDGWFACLAPDDVHKDNESGGDPFGLRLPNPAADFIFVDGERDLPFVQYLRVAILQWGGFPGLDRISGFEALSELVAELEQF